MCYECDYENIADAEIVKKINNLTFEDINIKRIKEIIELYYNNYDFNVGVNIIIQMLRNNNKITEEDIDDLFDFDENNYTEYGRNFLETIDFFYTDNNMNFNH